MNPIVVLKSEHEKIEMELSELDFIIELSEGGEGEEGRINYPNLVHTFWRVCGLWDTHEKMEEEIFKVMEEQGFDIPIEVIFTEHEDLRGHVKKIGDAINSGSDAKVRDALVEDVKVFVDVLRKHSLAEDEVLAGVVVSDFSDEAREEITRIIGKYR